MYCAFNIQHSADFYFTLIILMNLIFLDVNEFEEFRISEHREISWNIIILYIMTRNYLTAAGVPVYR
jgi:hypothetical protein